MRLIKRERAVAASDVTTLWSRHENICSNAAVMGPECHLLFSSHIPPLPLSKGCLWLCLLFIYFFQIGYCSCHPSASTSECFTSTDVQTCMTDITRFLMSVLTFFKKKSFEVVCPHQQRAAASGVPLNTHYSDYRRAARTSFPSTLTHSHFICWN